MSNGLIYRVISKKRIADLNSGELPEDAVFEALKAGEFNNARCEDFRLTSWGTENIHIKNFVWKRGKFRGEFTDCIFSDGEMSEVDFWDSDFKNVTFKNVIFTEGEINSSYSDKYIFKLDNVVFENCTFKRFTIGQALNSAIYLNNCIMMKSNFYIKSSCIEFYKCSTEDEKFMGTIFIVILSPKDLEPIKIRECSLFGLDLVGDSIPLLTISAKRVNLNMNGKVSIGNLIIYCNTVRLDTNCHTKSQLDEIKNRYDSGIQPSRVLENVDILCSQGGIFGIIGFKIQNLKIAMTEKRPKLGSAIFYSQIDNMELVGIKTDVLRIDKTTINKASLQSCHFHQLKFIESTVTDLTLNSLKISKKMILNKTKIGHLSLERVSLDKKADWESESSVVAILDKPESKQKEVKTVSGQALAGYFDRTDVALLQ